MSYRCEQGIKIVLLVRRRPIFPESSMKIESNDTNGGGKQNLLVSFRGLKNIFHSVLRFAPTVIIYEPLKFDQTKVGLKINKKFAIQSNN